MDSFVKINMENIDYGRWNILYFILVVAGVILNLYVFFLSYNNGADENGYITQVFSLAAGTPQGWGLRSFFYPILLLPSVFLAKLFAIDSYAGQILCVRLLNWCCAWVSLWYMYKLGKRYFDLFTARLLVVFLLYLWPWIESSRHLMMDVPSAMWLIVSIWFISDDLSKYKVALSTLFISFAVFTKFQMGPAAIGIALAILVKSGGHRECLKYSLVIFFTASIMVSFYALVDYFTWGKAFSSVYEFIKYNFGDSDSFQQFYGEFPSAYFYLMKLPSLFDRIFPIFILTGFAVTLYRFRTTYPILLPFIFYFAGIQSIDWKNVRYLLPIVPLLVLAGAYGFTVFKSWLVRLCSILRINKDRSELLCYMAVSCTVLVTLLSFLPLRSLGEKMSSDAVCADFVYDHVLYGDVPPKGSKVLFFGKCAIPKYFINKYYDASSKKFDIGNLRNYGLLDNVDNNFRGVGEEVRNEVIELESYLSGYEYAILQKNSLFDEMVIALKGKQPVIILNSNSGEFLVYKLNR